MTRRITKCQVCKRNDAMLAAQKVAEDSFTFSMLGSHYRGFKVVKVCHYCANLNVEGIEKKYNDVAA